MLELPQPDREQEPGRSGSDDLGLPRMQGLVADVVVIGAGVAGLTAALILKRAGRRVAVLDAGRLEAGESCRTTAHLSEVPDTRLAALLSRLGVDGARLAIDGQRRAIDQIESWVVDLGVSCGFERVPGFLYAASGDRAQQHTLDAETQAAHELGYTDIRTSRMPAPFSVAGALRFDNQAQIQPRPYLAALESLVNRDGSLVVRGVRALAIEDEGAHKPCRVSTDAGDVFADQVIVATHVPMGDAHLAVQAKLSAYRSYVIAAVASPTSPAAALQQSRALLWDLADPYHYARTARIGARDFLIVGGGDHPVGQSIDTEQVLRDLAAFARDQFGPLEVTHRWSGQILETADGLPYVGQATRGNRIHFVTGLSGNGFTNGTLAGQVLADVIQGRDNAWGRLLSPDRSQPLAALGRRVGRNLVSAKHRLGGKLRGDARRLDELPPLAAMVTRRNRERLAVYRDATGKLFALSADCPHRGGQVRWNGAEKSWDCPSCGSRFNVAGQVLNGPAAVGLSIRPLDEPGAGSATPAPAPRASASGA
jgi:glycine/D-amino acid oxidase-like deaminating enzyme/nitrite reductase/ring-hydroxylating ferredoxin subunit